MRFRSIGIATILVVAAPLFASPPVFADLTTKIKHDEITVTASKYKHAAGSSAPPPHNRTVSPKSQIEYMTVPWGGQCTSTAIDQVCTPVSDIDCSEQHPTDKNNHWMPFDIYISTDGGDTYPGYSNKPDQRGVCLNTVALKSRTRPPLDPQLVFKEASKLVPKGEWHPEPDGQAVVNKPVIVTVETNRDQAFKPFTLLGYHVEVKAHIDSYEWQYGDGSPASTVNWPGQDFNSSLGGCTASSCTSYVNHAYDHAGAYSIQLTLHWRATYRVDGGNWQPVPGNITTTSPTQNMTILNAHSQLVTGN